MDSLRIARALVATGALLAAPAADAVLLDGNNRCSVKMKDGTDVVLYGEFVSSVGTRRPLLSPLMGAGKSLRTLQQHALAPAKQASSLIDARGEPTQKGKDFLASCVRDQVRGQRGVALSPSFGTPSLLHPAVLGSRAYGLCAGELQRRHRAETDAAKPSATSALQDLTTNLPDFEEPARSNRFYYLPPGNSLRLSERPAKPGQSASQRTPEFLFVKYTTEERADAGGVQGGLLHFLMEWSLTPDQEAELRSLVKANCKVDGKPGELVAAAEVGEGDAQGSFRLVSATLSDEGMTRSVVKSGHAPTMPGGKVAVAANLDKNGAQLFMATLEKSRSIADLSVELDFEYVVQLPAAKGEIIFHWDKLQENEEVLDAYFRKSRKTDLIDQDLQLLSTKESNRVRSEQAAFNTMIERGVVQFNFEGYRPDDAQTQQIMQAMLQFFTDNIMKPDDGAGDVEEASVEDAEDPDTAFEGSGRRTFDIDREKLESAYAAKKQIVRLDAGLAVKQRFQVVGNVASWYDAAKDNRDCVMAVNLNDPFFEHRDIRFILDLDAKEIFEDMVNYVTVNVRKVRPRSTNFERSLTIDQEYLKTRGVQAAMSYAREGDVDTELYEYETQWSIRGGNLWPRTPRWRKGSWEGVTLSPPIERWAVEVEGDLDQMQANDIARVTVEMHYPLFGKEEYKVLALSPRGGNWLVSDHIYVDRGTRVFAYRLIVHHKTEGRMALPWQTRVGDRYVYATIPEELLVAGSLREQAKSLAKQLGQLGSEQVLDRFQELFSQAD